MTAVHHEEDYAEFGLLVRNEYFDPEDLRWHEDKGEKFLVSAHGYLAERIKTEIQRGDRIIVLGHLEFPEGATTVLLPIGIGKDLSHPRP